jgi:glycolate oxidase FAD binding subunit
VTDILRPRDVDETREAVAWALAHTKRLEVRGAGSKAAVGRPAQTDVTLDLSDLTGVLLYEPEELVLSAAAGTPVAELETLLEQHGQELAFEPMDGGPVLAARRGGGTIGGTLATNLSGPRRIKSGAARDHFLGVRAVSGRAEAFKAGGRVVKNVTGYDIPKLLAGSWGTLGIMTEATVKVLPKAETAATVLVQGLPDADAVRAMSLAMGASVEISGAAHLPPRAAAGAPVAAVSGAGQAITAMRLEGFEASVAARREVLVGLMSSFGAVETIGREESIALWRFIRDAEPLADGVERPLWRISVAPTEGPALVAEVARSTDVDAFYDWAGGLVWLALSACADAGEPVVRRAVGGGHAMLFRAAAAVRAAVPVFQPEAPALAALSRRVKESFDPNGILNPGRMWAGV